MTSGSSFNACWREVAYLELIVYFAGISTVDWTTEFSELISFKVSWESYFCSDFGDEIFVSKSRTFGFKSDPF